MSSFLYSGTSDFSEVRSKYANHDQAATGKMDGQFSGTEQLVFEPEDEDKQPSLDAWTHQEDEDDIQDAVKSGEEDEQDHDQDLEVLDDINEAEDGAHEADGDEDEGGNNIVTPSNAALINNAIHSNVVDNYAAYTYDAANDPFPKKLKLPSQQGSSSCNSTTSTPEALLYIDPTKIEVTKVALPASILNAALTNMRISEWSRMQHPLESIYTRIQSPTPTRDQVRAPGQGRRAGINRVLRQQVPNRMSGRNARYLERNGLLTMTLGRRPRKMIPDCTMGGMIGFSDAQWFFNVRGVLQRGTFTMSAPIDYYQGLAADPNRVFNLPCPQDVTLLIRQELAKHGRILPTFLEFLRRNPAIVQHYNIDMTTGMPFANGRMVISPAITALPIVAVDAPVVAPVLAAPAVVAPAAVAPTAIAPLATAPDVTSPVPAVVPSSQHLTIGTVEGRPQKRGRDDEEDKFVEDNKKLRTGASPYDSSPQPLALASPYYDDSQQYRGQWQDHGVVAHQPDHDSHSFDAMPGLTWAEARHNQQWTSGNEFSYQDANLVSFDTSSGNFSYHDDQALNGSLEDASYGGSITHSQDTPLTESEAVEPLITFDDFNDAWNPTSNYLADALGGYDAYYDFRGINENAMSDGLNGSFEYSPDIPPPSYYVESIYPILDDENGFEYQGHAGYSGEQFGLEEDAPGRFALQGEVEDDGSFNLF